jgi:hypothetical protein
MTDRAFLLRLVDDALLDLVEIRRVLLSERPDPVIPALAAVFCEMCFTTSEAWRRATALREEAEDLGLALPDLPHAMECAGIRSAHALGRFLAKRPEVERIGKDRDGAIWKIREIAKPQTVFKVPRE